MGLQEKTTAHLHCLQGIDLMHWRHHAAMLGVQVTALYALVICDWHISDNCIYA